ncbi:siderophore ABC transporter substrate-binding protein [Actinomyces sp. ZJ308]|uniref:siderophore ABC transporter substrate-binding protein n=1 Tax=Actinomyces sp. ZJ308 TaxID=2708342 RepID=UPI001421DB12|nr:siderophore ABC transporter substrate-binding protein [Actinomyces sp. ZJ308]
MPVSLSRRRLLTSTIATAGLLALAACGSRSSSSSASGAGAAASAGSSGEAASYPVTVKHAQGEASIKAAPKRVVVLDYGVLDSMAALGLADIVVGVPKDGGSLPESLSQFQDEKYKDMGGLKEPKEEAIAEVGPDLVIVAGRTAKSYENLSKRFTTIDMSVKPQSAGASTATTPEQGGQGDGGGKDRKNEPSASMTEVLTSHSTILGAIFGKKTEAEAKVKEFTDAAAEVAALAKNAGKGLCLMTTGGKVSAFGKGSRFDVLFDEFGVVPAVENIDEATHGEAVSFEFIGQANPDVLFVLDRDATIGQEGSSAKEILNNELVTATNAWKNNKVHYLNGPDWYLLGAGFAASPRMAQEIKGDLSA